MSAGGGPPTRFHAFPKGTLNKRTTGRKAPEQKKQEITTSKPKDIGGVVGASLRLALRLNHFLVRPQRWLNKDGMGAPQRKTRKNKK